MYHIEGEILGNYAAYNRTKAALSQDEYLARLKANLAVSTTEPGLAEKLDRFAVGTLAALGCFVVLISGTPPVEAAPNSDWAGTSCDRALTVHCETGGFGREQVSESVTHMFLGLGAACIALSKLLSSNGGDTGGKCL